MKQCGICDGRFNKCRIKYTLFRGPLYDYKKNIWSKLLWLHNRLDVWLCSIGMETIYFSLLVIIFWWYISIIYGIIHKLFYPSLYHWIGQLKSIFMVILNFEFVSWPSIGAVTPEVVYFCKPSLWEQRDTGALICRQPMEYEIHRWVGARKT